MERDAAKLTNHPSRSHIPLGSEEFDLFYKRAKPTHSAPSTRIPTLKSPSISFPSSQISSGVAACFPSFETSDSQCGGVSVLDWFGAVRHLRSNELSMQAPQGLAGPSPPYEGTELSGRPSSSHWRQSKEGISHDTKHRSSHRNTATKESLEPACESFPNQLLPRNAEHAAAGDDLGPYFLDDAAMLPGEAVWPPSALSLEEPEEPFVGVDTAESGILGASSTQFLPHRHGSANALLSSPRAPDRLSTSHNASIGPEWNCAPNASGLHELRRKEGFSHLKSDSIWRDRGLARNFASGSSQACSSGGRGSGGEPSRSNRTLRQASNTSRDSSRPRNGITCPVISKAKKTDTTLKECRQTFATEQDAIEHCKQLHYECPICTYAPAEPHRREHSKLLTQKITWKRCYFANAMGLKAHIIDTHLKCLPCMNVCGESFFSKTSRKEHEDGKCRLRPPPGRLQSERRQAERPVPPLPRKVEELRKRVAECFGRESLMTPHQLTKELGDLLLDSNLDRGKKYDAMQAHDAISRLPPAVPTEGPRAREQQEGISAAALGLRFNEESARSEDRYEYAMAFLRAVSRDSLGALSHGVSLLYGQLKRGSSSAWSNRSNVTDSPEETWPRPTRRSKHCHGGDVAYPDHAPCDQQCDDAMGDGDQPFGLHSVSAVETIQSPSLFLQLDPEDPDVYIPDVNYYQGGGHDNLFLPNEVSCFSVVGPQGQHSFTPGLTNSTTPLLCPADGSFYSGSGALSEPVSPFSLK